MPGVPYGAIPRPTAAQRAQGPMSLSELRAATDPAQVASRLYNRMVAEPVQFAANLGHAAMTDPNWGYTAQGETDPQAVQQSLRAAGMAMTGSVPAAMLEPTGWEAGMMAGSGGTRAVRGAKGAPRVFPELAERYPSINEPVRMFDNPKKPEGYLIKNPERTTETKAFKKSRDQIMQEMNREGYDPYFDPAQRADVNPAAYPMTQETLTEATAKKPETRARALSRLDEAQATQNLLDAYDKGAQRFDETGNWYFMKQLEDKFIQEYGPEEGARQFQDKFAKGMASTTAGQDPKGNFLMTMYGNYMRNKGERMPDTPYQPYPVGGRYPQANADAYNKYLGAGQDIQAASNPKRYNFMYNFLGSERPTIDEVMSGLIKPGAAEPEDYGVWQALHDRAAAQRGFAPGQTRGFQDVAWSGAKGTGQPMIGVVNDSIERTSRLTGLPPDEVVRRGIVRSEMPMYTGGPAAAAAGGVASRAAADRPRTPEETQRALQAFLAAGGA